MREVFEDAPTPPNTPVDPPPPVENKTPAPKPAKPHKWRRRILRLVIVLLALMLILRGSLRFLVPWAINRAANTYNLCCTYEKMDLYLIDGDVGIWHLKIEPKEGGAPLAQAEYCRGDISTLQLFRGQLHVQQLVADGVELNIERKADGSMPLLQRLLAGAPPTAPKNPGPTKIDLSAPLRIDAMRLIGMRAHVHDAAVSPPLDAQFNLDARLSDLDVSSKPARFRIEASSDPILDVLRIEGQGTSAGQSVDSTLQVFMRGLHVKEAAPYLLPLGVKPVAEGLGLTMSAHLTTWAANATGDQIKANLDIDKLSIVADGQPAVRIEKINLATGPIGTGSTDLGALTIDDVKLASGRQPDGAILALGFELIGAPPGPPVKSAPAPVAQQSSFNVPWSMSQISISKVDALFDDRAFSPPIPIHAQIPQLVIKDLGAKSGAPPITSQINMQLILPGVMRSMKISGSATPFADRKSIELAIQGEGLNPQLIKPYLQTLGLTSLLSDASFKCKLSADVTQDAKGVLTANAHLHEIVLRDAADLLTLDDVAITELSADPELKAIRIKDMQITGPMLAIKRDRAGLVEAIGLRLDPNGRPLVASPAVAPTTEPTTTAVVALPRCDIDHFSWKGTRVQITDQSVSPPSTFGISDLLVDLRDLHMDPSGNASNQPPGKLNVHLVADGLADDLTIAGDLAPSSNGISANLEISGNHLHSATVAPYLRPLGMEPLIHDGSLYLKTTVALATTDKGLKASASLTDLSLKDGDAELLGAGSVKVSEVTLQPSRLDVGDVEVINPRVSAGRDESGALYAAGVKLVEIAPPPETMPAVAAPTTIPSTTPAPVIAPPVLSLKRLMVKDADVRWNDRAGQTPADVSLKADVELDQMTTARDAAPARFKISSQIAGIIEQATIDGTIAASPDSAAIKLAVNATGIHEGQLVSYLPPGTHIALKDGRFRTTLDASVAPHPDGGNRLSVRVADLDYRDGADGPTLLKFDSGGIVASRIDPQGGIIAIDEIALAGLETGMTKAAADRTQLLGLEIGPPPATQPSTRPAAVPAPATAPAPAVVRSPASRPAADAQQLASAARKALPLITVEKIDLNLKQVSIVDQTRPQASPIKLVDVHLASRQKIEMLGSRPGSRPPVLLDITGQLSPLADSFTTNISLAPFADRPALSIQLSAIGIKGEGLMACLPELKPQIDGSALTDGRVKLRLEGQANLYRRTPIDVDLFRAFDLGFELQGLEFRNGESGPLLGGIEDIRSDLIRVDPQRNVVVVRSLEITKPAASFSREKDGIHAFGLLIKPPATQPAVAATHSPSPAHAPAPPPTPAPAPPQDGAPAAPAGEVKISRLLVNGLDVRIEDHTVKPPLIVPLNNLDVDVRDLSSRATVEDKPIRFTVLLNAGQVPLPKRDTHGAIGGALTDIAGLATGQNTKRTIGIEQRDLFSEIEASGKVSLYPKLKGWIKSSVSGLELVAFKGNAAEQGIILEAGTFDQSVDIRFPGDGSMEALPHFVVTDLEVSEPPNGPIVRYLHLPAPLDAVLAVLRDKDGSITVPLHVKVHDAKNFDELVSKAEQDSINAFDAIVVTALANAPAKVAGAVVDIFVQKKDPEKPTVITFAPGDATLDQADLLALAQIAQRLRKDQTLEVIIHHNLAERDAALAAQRANPSAADCLGMVRQLSQHRDALLSSRSELAGQARILLGSGASAQAESALTRLRRVERDIAATNDALDQIYDLLRPGAERQAPRRTQQASLEIGQRRLEAIRAALALPQGEHSRVKLMRPESEAAPDGGTATLRIVKIK